MGTLTAATVAAYFDTTFETLRIWAEIAGFPQPLPSCEGFLYREADINVWLFWIMQRNQAEILGLNEDAIDLCYPEPPYADLMHIDPIDAGEQLARAQAKS